MSPHERKQYERDAFAQRFNQALQAAGYKDLKWRELADIFGVSIEGVRKWARGQGLPTTARINQISEILNVSPEWLQFGKVMPQESKQIDKTDEALMLKINQMTLAQKKALLDFLQSTLANSH